MTHFRNPKRRLNLADGYHWFRRYSTEPNRPWDVVKVVQGVVYFVQNPVGMTVAGAQDIGSFGKYIRTPQ